MATPAFASLLHPAYCNDALRPRRPFVHRRLTGRQGRDFSTSNLRGQRPPRDNRWVDDGRQRAVHVRRRGTVHRTRLRVRSAPRTLGAVGKVAPKSLAASCSRARGEALALPLRVSTPPSRSRDPRARASPSPSQPTGPVDEETSRTSQARARLAPSCEIVACRTQLRPRWPVALQCGAFHVSARKEDFIRPARRAVHGGDAAVPRSRSTVFGWSHLGCDGWDVHGQRHRALLATAPRQPGLRIYKPCSRAVS